MPSHHPLGLNPKCEIEMSGSRKAKVEEQEGPPPDRGVACTGCLALTRISAALDVKAVKLVFSRNTFSLPALLPSHLTC